MNSESLSDRVILVAGGTGGIGSATCRLLGRHGASLVIVGRSLARAGSLASELRAHGTRCDTIIADLRTRRAWEDVVGQSVAKLGRIDVMIHCVGILIPGSFESIPEEGIRNVIATNIESFFWGVRAVLPLMHHQGRGHIITIGSQGGIVPMPYEAIYSATKSALRTFSAALAEELRPSGIMVSHVSAGSVRTPMLDLESGDENSTVAFVPRPIEPRRIAAAVLRILRKPKREVYVPGGWGVLSKLLASSLTLSAFAFRVMRPRGLSHMKNYRRRNQLDLVPQPGEPL